MQPDVQLEQATAVCSPVRRGVESLSGKAALA